LYGSSRADRGEVVLLVCSGRELCECRVDDAIVEDAPLLSLERDERFVCLRNFNIFIDSSFLSFLTSLTLFDVQIKTPREDCVLLPDISCHTFSDRLETNSKSIVFRVRSLKAQYFGLNDLVDKIGEHALMFDGFVNIVLF
jgi:hypothetical protein